MNTGNMQCKYLWTLSQINVAFETTQTKNSEQINATQLTCKQTERNVLTLCFLKKQLKT